MLTEGARERRQAGSYSTEGLTTVSEEDECPANTA